MEFVNLMKTTSLRIKETSVDYEPRKKISRTSSQSENYFESNHVSIHTGNDMVDLDNKGGKIIDKVDVQIKDRQHYNGNRQCNIIRCTTEDANILYSLPVEYNSLPYQKKKILFKKYGLVGSGLRCCNNCFAVIVKDINVIKGLPIGNNNFNERLKYEAVSYTICQKCFKTCEETLSKLIVVSNNHIETFCFKCLREDQFKYDLLDLSLKHHYTLLQNYKTDKRERVHHRNNPYFINSSYSNSTIASCSTSTTSTSTSSTNINTRVTLTPAKPSAVKNNLLITKNINANRLKKRQERLKFLNSDRKCTSLNNPYIQKYDHKSINSEWAAFFNLVCHSKSAVVKGFIANVKFSITSFSVFNFCEVSGCIHINIKAWLSSYDQLIQLIPRGKKDVVKKVLNMFRLKYGKGQCCWSCFSNMKYYIAYLTGQLLLKIDRTNTQGKTHNASNSSHNATYQTASIDKNNNYHGNNVLQHKTMQNTLHYLPPKVLTHSNSNNNLSTIILPVTSLIQPKSIHQNDMHNQKNLTKDNPSFIRSPYPNNQKSPHKSIYPTTVCDTESMKLTSPNKNINLQMPVIENVFSLQNLPIDYKSPSETVIDAFYHNNQLLTIFRSKSKPTDLTPNLNKDGKSLKTTSTNIQTLVANMSKADNLLSVSQVTKSNSDLDANTLKSNKFNSNSLLEKNLQDCNLQSKTDVVPNRLPYSCYLNTVNNIIPEQILSPVKVNESSGFINVNPSFDIRISTSEHYQSAATACDSSNKIPKAQDTFNEDSKSSLGNVSTKHSDVTIFPSKKQLTTNVVPDMLPYLIPNELLSPVKVNQSSGFAYMNPSFDIRIPTSEHYQSARTACDSSNKISKAPDFFNEDSKSSNVNSDISERPKVLYSKMGEKSKCKLSTHVKSKLKSKTSYNLKERPVKKIPLGESSKPTQDERNEQPSSSSDKTSQNKEDNAMVGADYNTRVDGKILEQRYKLFKELKCNLHVISKGQEETLLQELLKENAFSI